jgi:hypothetical protein
MSAASAHISSVKSIGKFTYQPERQTQRTWSKRSFHVSIGAKMTTRVGLISSTSLRLEKDYIICVEFDEDGNVVDIATKKLISALRRGLAPLSDVAFTGRSQVKSPEPTMCASETSHQRAKPGGSQATRVDESENRPD